MKTAAILFLSIMILAISAFASPNKLTTSGQTEFFSGTPVQVFSPDALADRLLTVKLEQVTTDKWIQWMVTSPVACKVYKSYSTVGYRSHYVAIPIAANTPLSRGIGANAKFAIFSGCTGAIVEKH